MRVSRQSLLTVLLRCQSTMAFKLPKLPYSQGALAPHISAETLEYHYGKHHAAYVNKLNELSKGNEWENKRLIEIIRTASGGILNQAGQIYNHCFYWESLSPNGGGEPTGKIADLIKRDFGSFAEFKNKFSAAAAGHFGSGWAWLVQKSDGKLSIEQTHDGASVVGQKGLNPLLTCDVWEHAYYIDYRNNRAKYVESWWNLVNWQWANERLRTPEPFTCDSAHA